MKKNLINERDINLEMFKTMRSMMTEEFDNGQASEVEASQEAPQEDVEGGEPNKVEPSEMDVSEAQSKFRQNVATDAQFSGFTILPDEGNIIFSGSIPGLGKWVFEYTQKEGFGFDTDSQVTMTDTNFEVLKKMFGYFVNWREEMSEKLIEYKQGNV